MKTVIVSYSKTGNNKALAMKLQEALDCRHIVIAEAKTRSVGRIAADVVFKRVPRVEFEDVELELYDRVLFVGPIWMGLAASPFRSIMNRWSGRLDNYSYISISGGALGPNPGIEEELKERLKKPPKSVIDLHIADLLPSEVANDRKATSAYHINDSEAKKLAGIVVEGMLEKER